MAVDFLTKTVILGCCKRWRGARSFLSDFVFSERHSSFSILLPPPPCYSHQLVLTVQHYTDANCFQLPGLKMGVFWVVFLTCGLLTSSQGLPGSAPVSARVDKGVLESAITGSLANGNLLQGLLDGLLGADGLLGGLLGPNGLVGGLLGGDGLVGGLLGGDGLVGGLLGGNGLVGGILGGDGPAGGLLGGDGLVGGLLGGGGPVGGLLGDDGLAGGLVGGDGAVGGLLGGDGPAGSLLGGNGAVGGLLGGGGPTGGLLGGDGLVGGLLGGGLLGGSGNKGQGSLLGGDLLGKDGLLGTVQGLTGLRIVNITLPKITLRFLPGIGLQLNIYTQLLIDGNGAVGGLLQLQVEANITARVRLVQDKSGALRLVVEDCKTLLGDINIRVGPKVPLVEKTLKSVLGNVLPRLLCPVVDTVLGVVNSLLGSVTSVLPLGALGNLQYTLSSLPIIGDKSIQLDLNLLLRDAEGNVVEPAGGLSMPVTLPPASGPGAQLGLSQGVLGAVLALAQRQGAFSMDISSSAVPNSIPLTTSALLSAFPQLSTVLPGSLPLALRVRLADAPVVALRDGKATATLRAAIDVLANRPGFPPQTLFTLDSDIVLDVTPSVSGGRLRIALAVDRVNLRLASSQLGPINVSRLEGWVKDVLAAAYTPAINNAVGMGIPLPNIFNTSFENGQVDVADNTFVINQSRVL
ncbi:BPI fold-containing family B member 4-like isoform X2 [Numida meleagris]|uniref:BPI fold-containing family B member 4-like isoform X2 n=1 Tax=Numida meleagris TaxID=8996 RepID=UPI000B3E1170|nr:BPI fold-containing family B member 4-like isoform X2 [Numida meleagris]